MEVGRARPHDVRGRARPLALFSVRRAVAAFLAAGLVVVLALGGLLALVQQRSATQEAERDATTLTATQADLVGASLTSAALVPGPGYQALDRLVRERVLDDRVVRVKIWSEDGRVVYSDDPTIVGHRFTLSEDELTALRTGAAVAEVSDPGEAETLGEKGFGKVLQVYLGVRTADGQPLLFETYRPYDGIEQASKRLWWASLPVLLGGLALLYLLQAPLAYRMATRLRATQEERERLLVASLASADREKAQIAADLHAGVVQGLTGASYTLSAAAAEVRAAGEPQLADTVHGTATDLRRWVRELRGLIVRVAPPPTRHGLEAALVDLLGSVDASELAVDLSVDGPLDLDETTGALVYRVVQEALRNVVLHASATRVQVRVHVDDQALELTVSDDGRGFSGERRAAGGEGVGLELLTSLASAHGGRLEVDSRPGTGTVVHLALPVSHPVQQEPTAATVLASELSVR